MEELLVEVIKKDENFDQFEINNLNDVLEYMNWFGWT